MRIVVAGSRDYQNRIHVFHVLDCLDYLNPIQELAHGGAHGVDTFAGEWAEIHAVPLEVFPAQWELYGKDAGPLRNYEMLSCFQPDVLVAFPGGKGTANCIRKARDLGIHVLEVQ